MNGGENMEVTEPLSWQGRQTEQGRQTGLIANTQLSAVERRDYFCQKKRVKQKKQDTEGTWLSQFQSWKENITLHHQDTYLSKLLPLAFSFYFWKENMLPS